MANREYRRLKRMQKERERDLKRENRASTTKKVAVTAAAIGVGYVAFQNKDLLEDKIKGVVGAGRVLLSRATESKKYKGKIDEAKNLSKAFGDTYGNKSPIELIKILNERKEKGVQFRDRIADLNKITENRGERSTLPDDLKKTKEFLSGMKQNKQTAFNEAAIENLQKILQKDEYKETFGEDLGKVETLFKENPKMLKRDLSSGLSRKDGEIEVMPKSIIDLLNRHNNNEERTLDFKIEDTDTKKKTDYMKALYGAAKETGEVTRKQQLDFEQGKVSPDNTYAAFKNLFDYTSAEGIRRRHSEEKDSFIAESLAKRGFKNATMGDAQELYVVRDGDRIKTASKTETGAEKLQDLFRPEIITKDVKGVADDYIETGRKAGFNVKDLKKDRFSADIYINEETGELINTAGAGKVVDSALDHIQQNYQIPILGFNPLDLSQRAFKKQQEQTRHSAIYASGEVHGLISKGTMKGRMAAETRNIDSVGVTDQSYIHIGDKIYDSSISERLKGKTAIESKKILEENLDDFMVGEGYRFLNAGQGHGKRMAEVYSGRTNREDVDSEDVMAVMLDKVKKFSGLNQESESNWGKAGRMYGKFQDVEGPDNILGAHLYASTTNVADASTLLDSMEYKLRSRAKPLSADAQSALHGSMAEVLNKRLNPLEEIQSIDLESKEGLFKVAELVASLDTPTKWQEENAVYEIEKGMQEEIKRVFNFNKENPDAFFDRKTFLKDQGTLSSFIPSSLEDKTEDVLTGQDVLRRMVEQYSVTIMDSEGQTDALAETIGGLGVRTGTKVKDEVDRLRSLSVTSFYKGEKDKAETVQDLVRANAEFQGVMASDDMYRSGLQGALSFAEPWHAAGIAPKEERLLKNTFVTPVKEYKGIVDFAKETFESDPGAAATASERAKNAAQHGADYVKQGFGFFKPIGEEGTTDKHVLLWNIFDNLDKRMAPLGLGLPNKDKMSPSAIMLNQFAKKIVLPYVAFQQAKWADDMLLGGRGSKAVAQTYANMHISVAGAKEKTGINTIGRDMRNIMPWLDQVDDWGATKAVNFATFGLIGDSRSAGDVQQYYESGEDAIRKGRNWGMGSSGPWRGTSIKHYEPNWYRKTMSDYQYTDTMYGSRREYWRNNAVPTLTNPLAPVRHFVTDPYHYEDKHKDSRPYAVTGGFAEAQMIPVIGPGVDRVISGVLKPQRTNPRLARAHREYLAKTNENITAQYLGANAAGTVNINPGGGAVLSGNTYSVSYKDEDGYMEKDAMYADSIRFKTERDRMSAAVSNNAGPIPMPQQGEPVEHAYAIDPEQLASLEEEYGEGGVAPLGVADVTTKHVAQDALAQGNIIVANQPQARESRISQLGSLHSATTVHNLDHTINSNALSNFKGAPTEMLDRLSAFGGIYGFGTKSAMGLKKNDKKNRYLQSSDTFQDYPRRFMDMNLGGLGGNLSEIGRRYLTDRKPGNRYNPIRNTMPDWLPGQEYFVDFQHGDPFSKIEKGEIRLPGESYETLYPVKKDAHGNYSAFDRYRILADVAPYSDQYRLAKKEVALLNGNDMLSEGQQEEYRTIRKQVSSKMNKKDFYERKYGNANIDHQTVTITDIIDQNTFLTKEYGNNPLKLAGVSVKADDEENVALVGNVIKVGAKVRVGLDSDPMNRVRDDMLDTMRVVVYAGTQTPFNSTGLRSGENLNYKLSRQSKEAGGNVTVRDDGSAVATRALTADGHITMGKLSEWMVHDVIPNTPILNVFADTFLPVRSPVEAYKKELYSKSFRDWKAPIKGWVRPMFESAASRNPLAAAAHGAGIGYMVGIRNKPWNVAYGLGAVMGVTAGIRTLRDFNKEFNPAADKERWIPERREKERDVNEYFDKIQYVKYKGLYERASELARKKEGMDLDTFFRAQEQRGRKNKNIESYLKEKKKWLTITKKTRPLAADMASIEIDEVNEQIKNIDADRPTGNVGAYTALALRYKDEYESTLYGSQDTYDFQKIYRALPKNDKEYFTAFQNASPKERQEILSLVPKNQRRIYQQQFGMDVDEKESLDTYFKDKNMPDQNWEGWRADVSLDNIKVKVMRQEGIDLTEDNVWEEDEMRADESGVQAVEMNRGPSTPISSFIDKARLESALKGAGLKDVRVNMATSASDVNYFGTKLSIERQREQEIEDGMKEHMNGS